MSEREKQLEREVAKLRPIVEAIAAREEPFSWTTWERDGYGYSSEVCGYCTGESVHDSSCPWLAARAYVAERAPAKPPDPEIVMLPPGVSMETAMRVLYGDKPDGGEGGR